MDSGVDYIGGLFGKPPKHDLTQAIKDASNKRNLKNLGEPKDHLGTKMSPSQPLNAIARDGLDDSSPVSSIEEPEYVEDDKGGEWTSYNEICRTCQIERIIGTCDHCGIHLYGSGTYPNLPFQFDVKVRRRQ